jgi:hypothetical protein
VGWITRVTAYSDGKCVTGVKPTYGYGAKGARLLGRQSGGGKDLKLAPEKGEFVSSADVVIGRCARGAAAWSGTAAGALAALSRQR